MDQLIERFEQEIKAKPEQNNGLKIQWTGFENVLLDESAREELIKKLIEKKIYVWHIDSRGKGNNLWFDYLQ